MGTADFLLMRANVVLPINEPLSNLDSLAIRHPPKNSLFIAVVVTIITAIIKLAPTATCEEAAICRSIGRAVCGGWRKL